MGFVQPHNQTIPILGRFHRLDYDVHALCLYKRSPTINWAPTINRGATARCRYGRDECGLLLTSHAHYRNVEFVGTPYALRLPPIPYMWQEAIGEAVQAFICMSIRIDTGLKKRQANDIIVNIMPILTVIKQADTVSPLAQINPAMSTDLKTCHIPGCVSMRGALNVAKLDFKVARVLLIASGNAAFNNVWCSCQSISVAMSMRGELRQSEIRCVIREDIYGRTISTVARTGPSSMICIDVTARTGYGFSS